MISKVEDLPRKRSYLQASPLMRLSLQSLQVIINSKNKCAVSDHRAGTTDSDPPGTVWPIRRTLLYHLFLDSSSNEPSSLFVLVSPQVHVENALVRILQSCSQDHLTADPFDPHLLLHYYCLGNWWLQTQNYSTTLRATVNISIHSHVVMQ